MTDAEATSTIQAAGRRSLLKAGAAGAALAGLGVPATASAQRGGGRIVFANGSAFDTMDPHMTFDVGRVGYRLNLYDGLMRWLDNPPKLEPWLAESYQVSRPRRSSPPPRTTFMW